MMRPFIIALLCHIVCSLAVPTYAQSGKQLPNIIFILADDLGYGDLTKFNKEAQIPTPNLTRLADQGLICTNAHAASSVCTPSRYGIITGRYAFRSSLKKGVLGGYSPALIEKDRFTIADLAAAAGYQTAIIGKWHLGLDFKPIDSSQPAIRHKNNETDLSNVNFNFAVLNGPNHLGFDYSYILPASLDMSPASTFKNKSNAGVYGDFVAYTDDAVGRILRCLDSLHLTKNTLVIVSSDNGADWKQKDLAEFPTHKANYIFRGEKSDIWDGGHRVPLILRWPGVITAKRSTNGLICLNDMMATLANLMHQQLPAGAAPDSYDCWPLFSGKGKLARLTIIHHSIEGLFAIRKGKWKYIDGNGSGGWSPNNPHDKAPGQLYNMEKDEGETTNLYYKYPGTVTALKEMLEQQKTQGYSMLNMAKQSSH